MWQLGKENRVVAVLFGILNTHSIRVGSNTGIQNGTPSAGVTSNAGF